MKKLNVIKAYWSIIFQIFFLVSFEGSAENLITTGKKNEINNERTFIINTSITDLNEFKELVRSASRLKKYGNVQINVGVVADNAFYGIPEGGNPWSEYASNIANLNKFYPDEKIASFIPRDFVKANCDLLLAKTKILRENGMDAAFNRSSGGIDTNQMLTAYCGKWSGGKSADSLYEAFDELNQAGRFMSSALHNIYAMYWNVSSRTVNRPLIVAPQRLSKEEEAYFLPYVFNVSEQEAQMDYIDIHGGRWNISRDSTQIYFQKILQVCKKLESFEREAVTGFVENLDIALRIHASLIRSAGNFAGAQKIRDRNADRLNGPIQRPGKESTWTGDPDLLKFKDHARRTG